MAKHLREHQLGNEAPTLRAISHEDTVSRTYRAWDFTAIALAAVLVVSLIAASVYGLTYAKVDTSAAVGELTIKKDDGAIFKMSVDENMQAQIGYCRKKMTGILELAGAETDTMLFQLKKIKYKDGSDASGAVLFVRMPRSGLQGDLSGVWTTYFSQPSANLGRSDWIFTHDDGTADYGASKTFNAITKQRFRLEAKSQEGWMWESKNSELDLMQEAAFRD